MRYDDWQTRFWNAMDEARSTAFEWGQHDCALFATKMADAICDSQYTQRAREAFNWQDARSAAEITRDGMKDAVETVLGEMQPWTRMCQGDIVLILDDEGRESLSIHDGCQLIGPDEVGVKVIPFRCAQGGWKVE